VAFDEGDVTRCIALVEDAQKQARRAGQEHVAEGATLLRAAAHLARDELLSARSLLSPIETASPAFLELILPPAVTLDIVESDAAAAAAKADVAIARLSDTGVGAIISDAAVTAFVAAGRIDDAERLRSSAHNFAGPAREPYMARAGGTIALATGRPADAVRLLEGAAATFARSKSTWEGLRTRLLLARARAAAGDPVAAAEDLASASADAEVGGIRLISRLAGEIRTALNLPTLERAAGAPSPRAAEHEREQMGSGQTVSVAATAIGTRADLWRTWGQREAQRLHGVVDAAPDTFIATFTGAGADDSWTSALRFALGLRDKATLLRMPVSAGVAAAVTDANRLRAAGAASDILASAELSSQARAWLECRELIDTEPAPAGSLRLRSRVSASRAAPLATPRRPDAQPVEHRNEFVLEGDFWSVTYAGATVRLKDAKGFHDIARLLAADGIEVAAVDLIGARTPADAHRSGISDGFGVEGDAGSMVDSEAREQYRSRLRELELELEEAAAANDPVREERARDEREFLLAELRSAVGLHGRARRAIDPSERSRKAVTWRIRDAITRAEAAHPAFGHHLRRSVRTGTLCVYDPPEPTRWLLVSRSESNP